MPDPQNPYGVTGIQYPTNYQPYMPPTPDIQYPTNFQPYSAAPATPLGGAMASMAGWNPNNAPSWMDWLIKVPRTQAPTPPLDMGDVSAQRAGYHLPDWMTDIGTIGSNIWAATGKPVLDQFSTSLQEINKSPDFGTSVRAVTKPLYQPWNDAMQMADRFVKNEGDPAMGVSWGTPEAQRQRTAQDTGLHMIGVPPEEFRTALEKQDYPALFGQGTGALLNLFGHYLLPRAATPKLAAEATPARPVEAGIPQPPDGGGPSGPGGGDPLFGEYTQPRLPGTERYNNLTLEFPDTPKYEPPAEPSMADMQRRAHAEIDARTQQSIFELTLDRAEALRNGDASRVIQIDQAILEAKIRANELKNSWQAPPVPAETPAPIFDAMPEGQGGLNFGAVRGQGGRFRQSGQFEYTPITRTGDPAGGPNEWQFPTPEPVDVTVPEAGAPSAEAQAATGGMPDIIDMPYNQAELALRKAEGYKTIPYPHVNPVNKLQQMVRGEMADMLPTTPAAPPVAPVQAPIPAAAAARKTIGKFKMGDDIVVPTEIVNADRNYISNMAENGYRVSKIEGGNTTFRHESKGEGGTRVGSMDIGEMINLLIRGAQQIRDSDMATKVRGAVSELRRRMQNGETTISPEEFRRVSAGIPNIDDLAQRMGIDLPDVRTRVGEPVRQEPAPTQTGHQEQLIRDARTTAELDALVDQFGDDYDAAANQGDVSAQQRAFELNRAVEARRAELNPPIQATRRTDHTNWLEANSPEGLQQIESFTDYQQLRTQIREWDDQRAEANRVGDRINGHRLYRMVMAGYDRLNELRDIQNNQRPRRSAESQAATQQMYGRVQQPVDVSNSWEPESSVNLSAMDPRQTSMYELADRMNATTRPSELAAIRTEVEAYLDEAIQDNFIPGISYARRLIDDISRRLGEPVQDRLNLEDQPVPAPSVQYGPQAPMTGNLKLSTPAYDRLARIVEGRTPLTKDQKKQLMASDRWQDYGIRTAQAAGSGPPGLSVEKMYGGRDRVVYRNPAGEPIVSAEVRTNPDGTREVPSLGADKTRLPVPPDAKPGTIGTFVHGTLLGRAVHQVGMKLVEMGAAFTSGATSPFTKNLVQSIMKRVSNGIDENSAELASLIRQLMHIKEVEGTLPRRIRTPEDVAQFIADMTTDEAAQPELPFEPRAARRESTAAERADVPEQMRLGEEVREEQMPLPLQSAVGPFGKGKGPSPGETTGRVAPFERPVRPWDAVDLSKTVVMNNPERALRQALDKVHNTGNHYLDRQLARVRELAQDFEMTPEKLNEFIELYGSILDNDLTPANVKEALPDLGNILENRIKRVGPGSEIEPSSREWLEHQRKMKDLEAPVDTTAKRWTGLMKQLDEMKAPDVLYREIISSPNTPPLKAGETWRDRVRAGIAFFESKVTRAVERLGTEGGEEGAINIGGMRDAVRDTIRNFFARGPETPEHPKGSPSTFEQLTGLSTAATTIGDISMPLRQGLAAIMTPEWRSGLKPMWQSFWSAERTREFDQQIRNNKVHQQEFNPTTGKWDPSYAQRANMKLVKPSEINSSEHDVAGAWIETGGNLGGVSKFYEKTWGQVAKMSNRAAATFLNHLRTGMLERLSDQAQLMAETGAETGEVRPNIFKQKVTPEQAASLNPYYNDHLAKILSDYINTATGRAPLKLDVFGMEGTPQLNLEFAAKAMGHVFFSPRNMFSRARLLYPGTYTVAPAFVRKQYLKSLLATGAAWATMSMLAKVGTQALGYDATISMDEESADFGKVRIGKTRLDLGGGFLPQYVAMWRLWSGFYRSSSTNQRHAYGQGFRPETQETQLQRFFSNKFNPSAKFGYDLLRAAQYVPFHVGDRTAQMFVPLVAQDMYEMFKEDPKLIPLLMPAVMLGGGTQIYGRGEQVAKIVPKKYDWVVQGGGLSDIAYPANWQIFGGK